MSQVLQNTNAASKALRGRTSRLGIGILTFAAFVSCQNLQLWAQSSLSAAVAPKALFIQVLEGEGELNDIRSRTAREPIVEVEDENHRPVAGALVLFTAHGGSGGASGTFSGLNSLTVKSGVDGRATARGYKPSHSSGNFSIGVQATFAGLTAFAEIHQTNFSSGGHGLVSKVRSNNGAKIAIAELAALAAATTTILLETRDASSTRIGVGTGTVTIP